MLIEDEKNKPQRKMDFILNVDRVNLSLILIYLDLKVPSGHFYSQRKRGEALWKPWIKPLTFSGWIIEIKDRGRQT